MVPSVTRVRKAGWAWWRDHGRLFRPRPGTRGTGRGLVGRAWWRDRERLFRPRSRTRGTGRGLVGGVISEADVDRLVVATLLGVHEGGKHPPVGVGRLAAQGQRPGIEPAGQDRVQLRRVHAELGEQQQERHDADDRAERPVGRRGVLQLVGNQTGPYGDQRGERDPAGDAPGSRPRGPIALAVSRVKVAKYSPALMTSRPASTGILIA